MSAPLRVLYFAWVRERVGFAEEQVSPPNTVRTVGDLMGWLARRGEGHAHAFDDHAIIRSALDRTHAGPATPLGHAREVAFFPPVTGG